MYSLFSLIARYSLVSEQWAQCYVNFARIHYINRGGKKQVSSVYPRLFSAFSAAATWAVCLDGPVPVARSSSLTKTPTVKTLS